LPMVVSSVTCGKAQEALHIHTCSHQVPVCIHHGTGVQCQTAALKPPVLA
jgi:hypothetical protein